MITIYGEVDTITRALSPVLQTLQSVDEPPIFIVVLRGLEGGAVAARDSAALNELRNGILVAATAAMERR